MHSTVECVELRCSKGWIHSNTRETQEKQAVIFKSALFTLPRTAPTNGAPNARRHRWNLAPIQNAPQPSCTRPKPRHERKMRVLHETRTSTPTQNGPSARDPDLDMKASWPSCTRLQSQTERRMALAHETQTSIRTPNAGAARDLDLSTKAQWPFCTRPGRQNKIKMAVVHEVWKSTCGVLGRCA
jgi:hypothetical protein